MKISRYWKCMIYPWLYDMLLKEDQGVTIAVFWFRLFRNQFHHEWLFLEQTLFGFSSLELEANLNRISALRYLRPCTTVQRKKATCQVKGSWCFSFKCESTDGDRADELLVQNNPEYWRYEMLIIVLIIQNGKTGWGISRILFIKRGIMK